MSDSLSLQRDGAVARVRLNRPELHNAFDAELIESLTGRSDSLVPDAAVRVVVLEGAGASFSAVPTSIGCAAWLRPARRRIETMRSLSPA
jgi:1,4-dihydroxy-2-naphthoyl-CoA synthase